MSSPGEAGAPDIAAGDSAEQRRAEEYLITRLGASLVTK